MQFIIPHHIYLGLEREENKDILRVEWFPKGSPEFNAVEECWKQGKYVFTCIKILS